MPATGATGLYGTPPADLVAADAGAIQLSPLLPGSSQLETLAESSLAEVIMLAPPGTIERRYALALALRALAPAGRFTVLAPKDKGGSRLAKELKGFGCSVGADARQHYKICSGERPERLSGIEEAIAEGAPRMVEEIGLWSQPGVFSWNRIDTGTAVLLEHLPELAGTGADFGCGIGVLARAVLASQTVTALTLVDIDRRAIEMAKRNIDDPRAAYAWADVRRGEVVATGLDFVVMNPPFHDGGAEDKALGQAFVRRAAQNLRKGGVLWLTANRHLPYEAVLRESFARVVTVAEDRGFKIIEAVK